MLMCRPMADTDSSWQSETVPGSQFYGLVIMLGYERLTPYRRVLMTKRHIVLSIAQQRKRWTSFGFILTSLHFGIPENAYQSWIVCLEFEMA